jgi:hypothetical protein
MPGRRRCGALTQSKGEADGYHRGLCFNRPASSTGRTERHGATRRLSRWRPDDDDESDNQKRSDDHCSTPSAIRSIEDRPATVVNKIRAST